MGVGALDNLYIAILTFLVLMSGCDMCACAPPAPAQCEPVRCRMYCEFGWKKNETTGCDMCACAPRPEDTLTPAQCEPVRCQMYCEFSWKKNETTGCDMCACAEKPADYCDPVTCYMACQYGWATDPVTGMKWSTLWTHICPLFWRNTMCWFQLAFNLSVCLWIYVIQWELARVLPNSLKGRGVCYHVYVIGAHKKWTHVNHQNMPNHCTSIYHEWMCVCVWQQWGGLLLGILHKMWWGPVCSPGSWSGRGWLPLILVWHRVVVGLNCSYCKAQLIGTRCSS